MDAFPLTIPSKNVIDLAMYISRRRKNSTVRDLNLRRKRLRHYKTERHPLILY